MKRTFNQIFKDWSKPLEKYQCKDLYDGIERDLELLYENSTVYPVPTNVFRAFEECGYAETKVVLLGQDPYHNLYKGKPSACGLAFATENGYTNPSLRIILEEMKKDVGYQGRHDPSSENSKLKERLLKWPSKGVLMLNTALTVEEGNPGSHKKIWDEWTRRFIQGFSKDRKDVIWMLWGKHAQNYIKYMPEDTITCKRPHPMVDIYSGKKLFRGSEVFTEVNDILDDHYSPKISW